VTFRRVTQAIRAVLAISATLFGDSRALIGQKTLWLCMLGLVVCQALALRRIPP